MKVKVKIKGLESIEGKGEAVVGALASALGVTVLPVGGNEGKVWGSHTIKPVAQLEDEIYLSVALILSSMYREMAEILGGPEVLKSLESSEEDKLVWANELMNDNPDGIRIPFGDKAMRVKCLKRGKDEF